MKESVLEQYHATRDFSDKVVRSACYAPFVSMFFDQMGNVQACCQNSRFPVGNIALQSLDEIWQGRKTQSMRKALIKDNFAAGCQFCEWQISVGNYLGTFTRLFERFPVPTENPEWPTMMEFSVSNTCNLECIMCTGMFSSSIRTNREMLAPLPKPYGDQFFKELRRYLPHLQFAKFLGGEPFLAQESHRIWEMMIEDGVSFPCHVTTNGTQYNSRVERVLENIPISFSISMDGFTKETVEKVRVNAQYETVLENFHRFLKYSRERGTDLSLTYCMMRQNWHEFGDYLLFADEHDCNVYVNTVREPAHCALFTLETDELAEIADALERQGETLLPKLGRNRQLWLTEVSAIRLRVENERQSSHSPFKTPLTLYIVDQRSPESIPESEKMTEERARAAFGNWGENQNLVRLDCDADDRILSVNSDDGTFFGLPGADCVGKLYVEVIDQLRETRGRGNITDLHVSGCFVDRIVDFVRDGELFAIRSISTPRLNEYGLNGGSTTLAVGRWIKANDGTLSRRRAAEILGDWSHAEPQLIIHRNIDDVVESIEETGAAAYGLARDDWFGKSFTEFRPALAQALGLSGVPKSEATWESKLDRIDRVYGFRSSKRIVQVREIMLRRFTDQGAFAGWTSFISRVATTADVHQMSLTQADEILTAWAPDCRRTKILCDLDACIERIEGDELAGLDVAGMVGKPIADLMGLLAQRFGRVELGNAQVRAASEDRTLEFMTERGPLYIRGIAWPRFEGAKHAGTAHLVGSHLATAESAPCPESDPSRELIQWAGGDEVTVLRTDREKRIISVEGPLAAKLGPEAVRPGRTFEELGGEYQRLVGGIIGFSNWRPPTGRWETLVEYSPARGKAFVRAVGIPCFAPDGECLGWSVCVADAHIDPQSMRMNRPLAEESLRTRLPESELLCVVVDSDEAVTQLSKASFLGVDVHELIGRKLSELIGPLTTRYGAPRDAYSTPTAYFEERRVRFVGPEALATVISLSYPRFDERGRQVGSEIVVAGRAAPRRRTPWTQDMDQALLTWGAGHPIVAVDCDVDDNIVGFEGDFESLFSMDSKKLIGNNPEELFSTLRHKFGPVASEEVGGCDAANVYDRILLFRRRQGVNKVRSVSFPVYYDDAFTGRRLIFALQSAEPASPRITSEGADRLLQQWTPGSDRMKLVMDLDYRIESIDAQPREFLGCAVGSFLGQRPDDLAAAFIGWFGELAHRTGEDDVEGSDQCLTFRSSQGEVRVRAITYPRFDSIGRHVGFETQAAGIRELCLSSS